MLQDSNVKKVGFLRAEVGNILLTCKVFGGLPPASGCRGRLEGTANRFMLEDGKWRARGVGKSFSFKDKLIFKVFFNQTGITGPSVSLRYFDPDPSNRDDFKMYTRPAFAYSTELVIYLLSSFDSRFCFEAYGCVGGAREHEPGGTFCLWPHSGEILLKDLATCDG